MQNVGVVRHSFQTWTRELAFARDRYNTFLLIKTKQPFKECFFSLLCTMTRGLYKGLNSFFFSCWSRVNEPSPKLIYKTLQCLVFSVELSCLLAKCFTDFLPSPITKAPGHWGQSRTWDSRRSQWPRISFHSWLSRRTGWPWASRKGDDLTCTRFSTFTY